LYRFFEYDDVEVAMKFCQFETHCHTAETSPCGVLSAVEVVEGIKAAGYAGTFITDHFYSWFFERGAMAALPWEEKAARYLMGYRAAKRHGDKIGVKVFLGLEVQLDGSPVEFLVYGPDEEFIISAGPIYRLPLPEFYRLMHENGFLVFQAHPYRSGLSPENPAYIDGIEIVNAQPRNRSHNPLALKFAAKHDVMIIAGGDVHMANDIGRAGIMVPEMVDSVEDFIAFYREVRTPELIITCGVGMDCDTAI
jgi:predicted metal-dependent phosphoesterase TrpH